MTPTTSMFRFLAPILAVALLLPAANAQFASFTRYGSACKTSPLSVTGVPRLGTTFSVDGIAFPSLCTRKFCGCNVGKCNDCRGAVLFVGVAPIQVPLPGGCPLLVTPDLFFTAAFPGRIGFTVPNNGGLVGQKFYMQRVDLDLAEYITTSCSKRYDPVAFPGTSDGVIGTIGL